MPDETLEERMTACLVDLRKILESQTRQDRVNPDIMLAEKHMTSALEHVKIYVLGVAL